MSASIDPKFEESLYETAEAELESLALQGMNSGAPIEAGPGYWEEKHQRLDERLLSHQEIK